MSTAVAAVILVAAIVAVYFFCVRPMRKGNCAMSGATGNGDQCHGDRDVARQIAELREEIRILHAQDALDRGELPASAGESAATRRPPEGPTEQ